MNEFFRRLLFLPPQASSIAPAIDHLHYFVITITMLGATLVTLLGGAFVIKYRRGRRPSAVGWRPPLWLELAAVGTLIGLFYVFWVIGARQFLHARVPPANTLDVYVTAKQWMWFFSYPDGGASLGTLYVPTDRPVRLIMTSRDVIHSFWVPNFRVKQDVLPGRYTTLWFEATQPGPHPILCAEYCGAGHSRMRGEVMALAPRDYERWRQGGGGPGQDSLELARVGQETAAQQGCLKCHSIDGSPHLGPTWAGLYGRRETLAGGESVIVDEAYLTESMMDPRAKIVRGFPANLMPSFFGRLRPAETGALVEFIKSLRDVPRAP